MGEEWYKDLPDDYFKSDLDIAYEQSFALIRKGLLSGLAFDDACATIEVDNKILREQIIRDMVKVLIAEEHFAKKVSIVDIARQLKVSSERLEIAKSEMLDEIHSPPLKNYYKDAGSDN